MRLYVQLRWTWYLAATDMLLDPRPLRALQQETQLTQFEYAQIANLVPQDAEEAKSIIPRYAIVQPTIGIVTSLFSMKQPYKVGR